MWLMSMLREIPREICAMDILCKGAHVGEMAPKRKNWAPRSSTALLMLPTSNLFGVKQYSAKRELRYSSQSSQRL